MQLWVIRACAGLTMWLCDAVMSHAFLSWFDYASRSDAVMSYTCLCWFDYVTAWCSYELYIASPDLTVWVCDAVISHACLSWFHYVTVWCSCELYVLALIWLCDCVMQLWVIRGCPDLTMRLRDAILVKVPHFILAGYWVSSSLVVYR